MNNTTTCSKCGVDFEITDAAMRKRMYVCKPCIAVRSRADYERRKAAGLRVSGTPMPREYHRAYQNDYYKRPEVRERMRIKARIRHSDPVEREKANIRRLTRRAIEGGRLVRQPCEVCGATKVDAHHDDYARPLDVRWLCRVHHYALHAKARGEVSK